MHAGGGFPKAMVELEHPYVLIDRKFIEIVLHLYCLLDNDEDKVLTWLKTKNPLLGNIAPLRLMQLGKIKKVYQFVINAEEGNLP